MKHYDDILPEESEAHNQSLLEELRQTYRPELQDAHALARIRERLLTGTDAQKQLSFPSTQQRERTSTLDIQRGNVKTLKPKAWRHTLGLVAAVLIASLLVGSLILTFTLAHRNTTGTGPIFAPNRPEMITEIHMFSDSTGWTLSTDNRVMRTTDQGVNWREVTPPDILNLETQFRLTGPSAFYDAVTAWVGVTVNAQQAPEYHSATAVLLFHTTDGGKTWQKTVLKFSSKITVGSFVFINAYVGWLLSSIDRPDPGTPFDIWHTIDGGKSWTKILDSSSPGAQNLSGIQTPYISFGSAHVGLMVGRNDHLYRTTDGGVIWDLQPWPAFKADTGFAGGVSFGKIQFFTAKDALFSGSVMLYDRSGVAQKINVIVYTTHDAGLTWHASPTLSLVAPQDRQAHVSWMTGLIVPMFLDMQHGWISASTDSNTTETGQSSLVQYTTTDGGQHWTQLPVSNIPNEFSAWFDYSSSSFVSPYHGWLVDTSSFKNTAGDTVLYRTLDGGRRWIQLRAHFPSFIRPGPPSTN